MKHIEIKKAIELREQGLSYGVIAEKLNVSKSSVSSWCRHIELTAEQIEKLSENCRINSILSGKRNKDRWDKIKNEMLDGYEPPFDNPKFMLGLGLYWGEGTKCGKSLTKLVNSNPYLVIHFIKWIHEFFPECKKFSARVYHYNEKKDEEIKSYWSNILNLPLDCFRDSIFQISKSSRKKKGNILPYGTVHIICCGKGIWTVQQKIKKALELLSNNC